MMNVRFKKIYDDWLSKQMADESNPRRRELLKRGLSHGTVSFLSSIWFPTIGNLNDLYPEYEVRDLNNRYRYLDLAYMPGGSKGCIEIHDYRSHARDVDTGRFKDLCMKQAMLVLDDWAFLPIAYLSIKEDPSICKKLVLSFVGKFSSMPVPSSLDWIEAETIRYARRILRSFTSRELALHLQRSETHSRRILQKLTDKNILTVVDEKQRYRKWQLADPQM